MNIYKIQRHIGEQTTPAKSQRYNKYYNEVSQFYHKCDGNW